MRRDERGRTRIRESIGPCLSVVRDTAHFFEGRRRRGKVIGANGRLSLSSNGGDLRSIARPRTCLQTRDRNLILVIKAGGGGSGRVVCLLMSLLIQTRVHNLIMIPRAAGGDLGSIAHPPTSLQTQDLNLILMTREAGGCLGRTAHPLTSSGRTAHPLTSVLLCPLVPNLILMTREAGVDLGSIAGPLMSLQTRDWNMMTRDVEGGVGYPGSESNSDENISSLSYDESSNSDSDP
ncbi:hypothetical protein IMY05_007G0123200 [Salix suchowensis]|nr:hypothetical protein IMY05_007G0123200 [Salix suchowensis]